MKTRGTIVAGLLVVYIAVIAIAVLVSGTAAAADQSPDAHKQALQCTVFASMGLKPYSTLLIHRSRAPKITTLNHAYYVGLAEGKVLGTADTMVRFTQLIAVTESAGIWYDKVECDVNEDT